MIWPSPGSWRPTILGNQNVTVSQILDSISELTGVPPPKMAIPYPAALVASFFVELIVTGIFGRPSGFPRKAGGFHP
jgi:hypothetical protein